MKRSRWLALSWVLGAGLLGCGSVSSQMPMGADAGTVADTGPVAVDVSTMPDVASAVDTGPMATPDVPAASAALVEARPYGIRVPGVYDGSRAVPLVMVLHGYGAAGLPQSVYFGLPNLANREGFLLAYPDGTVDGVGRRFWRASRACCDFGNTGVDDVAYLNAVLDDVTARYRVDPDRIYLVGHSNGGFMAHRMACSASSRIAAIVSLAGATGVDDDYPCTPTSAVSVLQIHGTTDATVQYTGGMLVPGAMYSYPSARASVERWRTLSQCGAFADEAQRLDLDTMVMGPETVVSRAANCTHGAVELWTMEGSPHIPPIGSTFANEVWRFLQAHPRRP